MTTKTPSPPRLVLRLPGTWVQLDPSRPDVTRVRIRTFVDRSIGRADQLATARADLSRALDSMLEYGAGPAAHESTFLCHELAPGVTAPIAISVFAPTDVRWSPAVGTDPGDVLAGFLWAMEAPGEGEGQSGGHGQGRGQGQGESQSGGHGDSGGGGDGGGQDGGRGGWRRLECADGWAARRWRVTSQEVAHELAEQTLPTFTAEYWRTVPGSKRLTLVTVTSPLAVIPKTMLRLADAVVAGSRFA